ncbi:hypothetical protein L596_013146 [Steinernema carpocapsae]|uniref:BTB domain-containing protein n=1 Tax=Steinernema carpocapsae TaxID=34508 RepID=A0A4U5NZY1_STECR|nr:hypothetical protein L596_013146 [Steinernema carpocapsae]
MANGSAIIHIPVDKTSLSVNIGEFSWKASIKIGGQTTCKPKKESATVLWNCFAMGKFVASHLRKAHYDVWTASFGNNCIEFQSRFNEARREKAVKHPWGSNYTTTEELHVDIVDSFYADLANPENALIEDPTNAAKLKIQDQEIWVSKKMLAAHSLFFEALFRDKFKEGTDGIYELKEQKLEEFLQFLGIVHGLEMGVDGKTVERLMHLGDYFLAKNVLQYCGEYLRAAHNDEVPLAKKIFLASRYNLRWAAIDLINKASIEELKSLGSTLGFSSVASSLIYEKLRLV